MDAFDRAVNEYTLVKSRSHRQESFIEAMAGNVGTCAHVLVSQPMDTVKVKMQAFPSMFSHSTDCCMKTFAQDRLVRGLYAGTMASLAGALCENTALFLSYDICHKMMARLSSRNEWSLSPLQNALSGGLAGLVTSLVVCPADLVKCRVQAAREMASAGHKGAVHIGPVNLTREILRKDGVKGLYRGLPATVLREVPGYFVFFGAYDLCRQLISPPGKNMGYLETIMCGGVGGVCCWVAIFPLDVLKTRIQISDSKPTIQEVFFDTIRKEGFHRLYAGLGPTLLRVFPSCGAFFLIYEKTKSQLQNLS